MSFLKWIKAVLGNGSDSFWENVGCSSLSSCPVTWIFNRVTPVTWVRWVHIFHVSSFADLVYSWDFFRVFHRCQASTVSNATCYLGWFYHDGVIDDEEVASGRWKGGNENIRLKCQKQCLSEKGLIDSLVWIPTEFSPDISEIRAENTNSKFWFSCPCYRPHRIQSWKRRIWRELCF